MVKIFQFLRLSTKFLAVLRLSVNPIETLFLVFGFDSVAGGVTYLAQKCIQNA